MPEQEPRRTRFWDAVAANALGGVVAAVVFAAASAIVSYAAAHLVTAHLQIGLYVFLVLVGLYLMGLSLLLTYRFWSRKSGRDHASLAFRIMVEECGFLLKVYRRMGFDDPEHTRYPLYHASWPNFQPPTEWTYTQITLWGLKSRFDWFLLVARRAFEEMGWNEPVELSNLAPEVTVMVDLIGGTGKFLGPSQSKSRRFGARALTPSLSLSTSESKKILGRFWVGEEKSIAS